MATDPPRMGEETEECFQSFLVLAPVRVDLRIGPFDIGVGQGGRGSVAWTADIKHIDVMATDEAIGVDPDEILAGIGSPVAQETGFDMRGFEGSAQKGIVPEIEHPKGEIIGRIPVEVECPDLFFIGFLGHGGVSLIEGDGENKNGIRYYFLPYPILTPF